ncbi:unnamed protein product [Prorocentrum cordatum]|uniref:PNPLA domain-containing protein n=1 Tax=Prorocentrum cordatum TaxID=2364126 RepID=A0ABN9SL79_9DINO|nr:unnamed protein product [Polarella glacialis]
MLRPSSSRKTCLMSSTTHPHAGVADEQDTEEEVEEEDSEKSSLSTSTVGPVQGFMKFDEVVQEERQALEYNRGLRRPDPTPIHKAGGETFSLAFSGGGIRATAFQLGVLWRLGEAGLLGNVDRVSAVSGGGWAAAAYVSHIGGGRLPGAGAGPARVAPVRGGQGHLPRAAQPPLHRRGTSARTRGRGRPRAPAACRGPSTSPYCSARWRGRCS